MVVLRLYRFYRRGGLPRRHALRRAVRLVWHDLVNPVLPR